MRLSKLPFLLLASLLAACRGEEASQSKASDPPSQAAPHEEGEAAAAAAGAVLKADGAISFHGASPFFCVPHEGSGLQVDFRTGDGGLPAVAVRIESYRGGGPHQAHLFVTGRSATGALVTSEGEADVDLQQENGILVSGRFQGRYAGQAGAGTIEGRFGSCNDSAYQGGAPPLTAGAAGAEPAPGGQEEQPAGASEETRP